MSLADIPPRGTLIRGLLDAEVVVGRFDDIVTKKGADTIRTVLPDLKACRPPMTIKITTSADQKHADETCVLQDSSGSQVFNGRREMLTSNYVVVVRESDAISHEDVYSMWPVNAWYTFTKSSNVPELSPEDQAELYDMLQRRMSAAASGGAGAASRQAGDEVGDGALDVDPEGVDWDTVYDQISGKPDGGGSKRSRQRASEADEGDDTGGRSFDVLGAERIDEEIAVDFEQQFDDDHGDAGEADDAEATGDKDDGTIKEGMAMFGAGGEDDTLDLDADEDTTEQRLMENVTSQGQDQALMGAQGDGTGDGADRAAKRARLDSPLAALREEVRKLIVASGGRITMRAVSKHFKRRLKVDGEQFKATLLQVLKWATRRVVAPDGQLEYVLKAR